MAVRKSAKGAALKRWLKRAGLTSAPAKLVEMLTVVIADRLNGSAQRLRRLWARCPSRRSVEKFRRRSGKAAQLQQEGKNNYASR